MIFQSEGSVGTGHMILPAILLEKWPIVSPLLIYLTQVGSEVLLEQCPG